MGQPCKDHDDPDSPDPNPDWGNTFLSPEQWKKQLDMLRKGRYRLSAIAARFGQTEGSIRERIRRHPKLRAEFDEAKATGEMHQCDLIADGTPGESEAAQWYLERIHRIQKPVDVARVAAYNAEARAAKKGEADLERQQALRRFLAAASTEAEGDPTADATNAGDPGEAT
jgi:hypothetical protein